MEARELRRSDRLILKEGPQIKTMKIADSDVSKERVQITCSVVGCEFRTEYLASVLAEKQSSEHWRARHKAKFDQDELDRLEELEEQRVKLETQRMKNDQQLAPITSPYFL